MDDDEIRKSAALENRHWWYASRRTMLRELMRDVAPGQLLDVGAGSGGNTTEMAGLGWQCTALEHSPAGAQLLTERGLDVVRGDGHRLPFADDTFDLVMATDVWEHLDDDATVAREAFRVTRPGGRLLVTVPAGMDLWSDHDVALGHHRRYGADQLRELARSAGWTVHSVQSWNVLLRPVVRARRALRRSGSPEGCSEMNSVNPLLNAALRSVLAVEQHLPLQTLPGVSLVLRAFKP